MAGAKSMTDFLERLREVNSAEQPGGPEPDSGKEAISTLFDDATAWSLKGECWNWGLYEQDVADEIETLIPGFGRFDDTDTHSEQLYLLTLRTVPIAYDQYVPLRVLEVGSGTGEGLNFLSR